MKTSFALSLGISLFGLSLGGSSMAALAAAETSATPSTPPFGGVAPPTAPQPVAPSVEMSADGQPAAEGEADELGLTAEDYAASIDYDVSYDDSVAQSYDDGYDPQAYTQFQDTLAPYGSWVDDPAYGEVWVPSASVVGDDFSPYATNGGWVGTEYGWTWVSGWSWGWAPFHYGRWTTIANHGWGWVPGTIWGPSWVSWRVGAGCVGWAPLPPRGVRLGSPLGPRSPWRFVGAAGFGHSRGGYLPAGAVPRIFGRMSVVSNARVVGAGGSSVRVNVGPTRRGEPGQAPAHLASVAPGVLPRFAVQPRAGVPLASRPWVRAGVNRQLAFNASAVAPAVVGARQFAPAGTERATIGARSGPRSYIVTGRVPPVGTRSYTVGLPAGFQRAPGGGGPVSASLRPSIVRPYGSATTFGGPHAAAPVVRSFASPALPGGSSSNRPRFYAPAPATRAFMPASGSTAYTPPRQWQSPPRFSPPVYARPSAAPSFGGTTRSFGGGGSAPGGGAPTFGGSAPSFGGGHPSFGGSAPSFGGGHPSFGASPPSFGGGHSFAGGHSFGGGGGRHR